MTSTLLMTGASRGFGRVAAARILRSRPDIHLLVTVRRPGLGLGPRVSELAVDLASQESVRALAGAVIAGLDAGRWPPLGGFLGNAGLQLTSRAHATVDGIETTFAVNVLANYLIVRLLWDHFAVPGRIVLVGSDTHFGDLRHNMGMVPAPRWDGLPAIAAPRDDARARTASEGRIAYSTSKLALLYLVHALASRLPPGLDVYTFNPGYVPGTGLVRDAGPAVRFLSRTAGFGLTATPLAITPATAGRLLAAATIGPRPGATGSYLDRGRLAASAPTSYHRDREEQLWQYAAQRCALP